MYIAIQSNNQLPKKKSRQTVVPLEDAQKEGKWVKKKKKKKTVIVLSLTYPAVATLLLPFSEDLSRLV